MKRWIAVAGAAVLLITMLLPHAGFTEDRDTVHLARVIYALARNESYQTKLAIGTVAMNRVDNPWYAATLGEVLDEQQQFPAGQRYDEESLAAAHAVLTGTRVLPASAVGYRALNASEPCGLTPLETVGGYAFYAD